MTVKANIIAKSNSYYCCQECGATEYIQAHHQILKDDSSIIVLCANCHSLKHPLVPKNFFINKRHQLYWHNKSASSLAKEIGCHPRTIIRRARTLGIPPGQISDEQIKLLAVWRIPKQKIIKLSSEATMKLREFLGWTQEKLAREVGISMSTLTRWESGKTKPSPLAKYNLKELIEKVTR